MKCIITIELGTNGIRVFAFDLNGRVIGSLKGYYPTFHTEPDHSEQDPEQIFITTLYVLKNLLNEHVHPKNTNAPVFVSAPPCTAYWPSITMVIPWVMPLPGPTTAPKRSPGITQLPSGKNCTTPPAPHPSYEPPAQNSLDQGTRH